MNPESPVTLRRLSYRGVVSFHLGWEEGGSAREASFETEAEAVVQMAAIEERLRLATMSGKGYTVNPFGAATPFITSKDVHFAALRLQPRGLDFREAITHYVAAVAALNGTNVTVTDAAREHAEALKTLKPFDVSLSQVVFEWVELKKQVGDRPLFELLRAFLREAPGASGNVPPVSAAPSPASAATPTPPPTSVPTSAPVPTTAPLSSSGLAPAPAASSASAPVRPAAELSSADLTMPPFPALWPPSAGKRPGS